jgi:hypothetical protein
MNKIIFFDIDGTLVRENNVPRLSILTKRIAALKNRGAIFGINTNRPWESAGYIYRVLKLNGPIILENGAVYKLSPRSRAQLINKKARDLNKKVIYYFQKNLAKLFPGATLKVGDDRSVLGDGHPLILISKNRKYTASIYVAGGHGFAGDRLAFIAGRLKRSFPAGAHFAIKCLPRQGKIIVANDWRDRISAMRYIRDRHHHDCNIFLISDNEDVPLSKDIHFCATENAPREYKRGAQYTAKSAGERGLLEIVKKII